MRTADHYDVLGVSPGAPADEVRRAYLARARALHPDRHSASSPEVARDAARAMQQVNEAWRVLRDPGRRRDFDERRRGVTTRSRASRFVVDDVVFLDPDVDLDPRPYHQPIPEPEGRARAVRSLPWIAVVVTLAAIFVFTAYAGGGGPEDDDRRGVLVGECVRVQQGLGVVTVPCTGPSDGRVIAYADVSSKCPSRTTAHDLADGPVICLRST